ncbi:hypothetical protein E4U42_002505 [Claviceps africana]|uniref:Uncharacterized protein n=1 Tax=Claviceps africana TaxID=83212 RepID=A0A8K0J7W5_9HYPO|nr:hypothetical protein E4U42_002505 [Claviceps africana]
MTGEDEAVAQAKVMRRDLCAEKPGFALYGTSDALVVFCQSLAGLDLARMADFAAAVVTKPSGGAGEGGGRGNGNGNGNGNEKGARTTPAGRIVSSVFNAVNWTDAGVDAVSLLGEDYGGGCWVMAKLSAGSWDSVLEELGGFMSYQPEEAAAWLARFTTKYARYMTIPQVNNLNTTSAVASSLPLKSEGTYGSCTQCLQRRGGLSSSNMARPGGQRGMRRWC